MKKLLQGALLPFVMFTSGILLLGCNPPIEQSKQQDAEQTESTQVESNQQDQDQSTPKSHGNLKQGNVFYIARDVADVQLKTGNYVEKLQSIQSDLQQAIDSKDQVELQQTVKSLSRELQGFNTALISLDLKSKEIDGVRQQVLQANKQVLNSAFLNGDLDVSKLDFKKIQKQMDNIQTDMMKLAGMVMLSAGSDESSSSQSSDKS